jgi:hypothetical protein
MPPDALQVFINYRTADTGPEAKHLAADLKRIVGDDAVFLDHERIEAGKQWPDELRSAVSDSKILLALVGRHWRVVQRARGVGRSKQPDDWVRQEIEAAFRAGKVVVPVLVNRSRMPDAAAFRSIPQLAPFASLQALPLRTRDWDTDVAAIVDLLCKHGFQRVQSATVSERGDPDPARSTIEPRGEAPFIGRAADIDQLNAALADSARGRFVVLQGQPGVGKSELAFEYARRAADRYPGGTFKIDMASSGPPADLALIGRGILRRDLPADLPLEDQARRALLELAPQRGLLIFDNVVDVRHADRWLPPAGSRCHVIATSTARDWPDRWKPIDVKPFNDPEARVLARAYAGDTVGPELIEGIVRHALGLPVQLRSAARAARRAVERGHRNTRSLDISGPTSELRPSVEHSRLRRQVGARGRHGIPSRWVPSRAD